MEPITREELEKIKKGCKSSRKRCLRYRETPGAKRDAKTSHGRSKSNRRHSRCLDENGRKKVRRLK
ncbi:hypothetical protein [Methanosarcina barkeri]|uniref:hypothetical protein n=1 Tax=Methanosarcina barkeri TaxID=2208 RepID=UPI000A740A73|nr:hypothetical protein [Methanosarcina barkeri]